MKGSAFEEDVPLKATCVSRPPGNPVGALFWRWHFPIVNATGHQPRRPAFYPLQSPFLKRPELVYFGDDDYISEDVPSSFYTTQHINEELITHLTIPSISRRYHGANLTCETSHAVGDVQRTSIYVNINCEFEIKLWNRLDSKLRPWDNLLVVFIHQ